MRFGTFPFHSIFCHRHIAIKKKEEMWKGYVLLNLIENVLDIRNSRKKKISLLLLRRVLSVYVDITALNSICEMVQQWDVTESGFCFIELNFCRHQNPLISIFANYNLPVIESGRKNVLLNSLTLLIDCNHL